VRQKSKLKIYLFNGPQGYTEKYAYISNSMNQITPHTSSCSPRTSSREPMASIFLSSRREQGMAVSMCHGKYWKKSSTDKRKEDKPEVDFLFPQQSTAINSSHGHKIAPLGGPPGGLGSPRCSLQVFPHQLLYLLY
jgi:hypothetical protein